MSTFSFAKTYMTATHILDSQDHNKLRRALILSFLCVFHVELRTITVGYISCRGTMHDKLCRALWFVKRVLWECVSNADSAYFWGALKPPRGSFKHKLNFNCFVQDMSETTWMWGWDVCHCYSLMRQMVTGLIAAMTHSSNGSWLKKRSYGLSKAAFLRQDMILLYQMDLMYLQISDFFFFHYRSQTGATLGNTNYLNKHPCH